MAQPRAGGRRAILYEYPNFQGRSYVVYGRNDGLGSTGFEDRAMSGRFEGECGLSDAGGPFDDDARIVRACERRGDAFEFGVASDETGQRREGELRHGARQAPRPGPSSRIGELLRLRR